MVARTHNITLNEIKKRRALFGNHPDVSGLSTILRKLTVVLLTPSFILLRLSLLRSLATILNDITDINSNQDIKSRSNDNFKN